MTICGTPFTLSSDATSTSSHSCCESCGAPLPPTPYPEVEAIFRLTSTLCEACDEAELARARKQQKRDHQLEVQRRFREQMPERYRHTNPDHPQFNRHLWEQVSSWNATPQSPWLGLVGPSGACKSRCAVMRAECYTKDDIVPRYVPARDFQTWSNHLFSKDSETYRKKLSQAQHCRVLIFDDLGKIKPTEGVVGMLFDLLEYRHSHNRTTLWTSNCLPEILVRNYTAEFADPIAGRLMEASHILLGEQRSDHHAAPRESPEAP